MLLSIDVFWSVSFLSKNESTLIFSMKVSALCFRLISLEVLWKVFLVIWESCVLLRDIVLEVNEDLTRLKHHVRGNGRMKLNLPWNFRLMKALYCCIILKWKSLMDIWKCNSEQYLIWKTDLISFWYFIEKDLSVLIRLLRIAWSNL